MTGDVIAQDDRIAALGAFLRDSLRGARAAVIEGEPGIGKTTLWKRALDAAERTHVALVTRAVEAEAKLVAVGLADLIAPVADWVLPALPEPQRLALDAALLLREPEAPFDPRALGVALLSSFRILSAERPLLVAIDDLQWLDAMSANALWFAARRLSDEPVALLYTLRTPPEGAVPSPEAPVVRLRPRPLDTEELAALVEGRLGLRHPPSIWRRIAAASGGNPFAALELAAALARRDEPIDPARPLPVPSTLTGLVADRLAALSAGARAPLLPTALLGSPTTSTVELAVGERGAECIDEAVAAGVLQRVRGRLLFSHPLLASVVTAQAGPRAERECHRRLAQVVAEPEARALHLALATDEANEEVAAAVGGAVQIAVARGAVAAAAELAEHALRLTPAEAGTRTTRLVEAGRLRLRAGAQARGVELLQAALEALPPGAQRAEVLFALAEGISHDVTRALQLLDQALAEADDDRLRARALGLHATLDGVLALTDLPRAEHDAAQSVRLAGMVRDPELLVRNLGNLAWIELTLGRSPESAVQGALALPKAAARLPVFWAPERPLLFWELRQGHHDRARPGLVELRRRAIENGEEEGASVIDFHLADLELRAGRWREADAYANRLESFAHWSPPSQPVALSCSARLAAVRGDLDRAADLARRGLGLSAQMGSLMFEIENRSVLGLVAVSRGDWEGAVAALEPARAAASARGVVGLSFVSFVADLVEANIELRRTEAAERDLEWLETQARVQSHPVALATALRCRALLAAAHGEPDRALKAVEEGLAVAELDEVPFEHARTLLTRGTLLRRARRMRAARESLTAALALFESLGARALAARAEGEVGRLGGRRPSEGGLTPMQRRVAGLAAEGLTNKQIAGTLSISEHTVDSHLRQIYAKLEVRSRAQLAVHLARSRESD